MPASEEGHIWQGPRDDWPEADQTLGLRLVARLQQLGDRVLQVFPSHGDYESSASWVLRQAAAELVRLRVSAGDTVAVCCAGGPYVAPAMLACVCAGAAVAPINTDVPLDDLRQILARLSPVAVLHGAAEADKVAAACPEGARLLLLGDAPAASAEQVAALQQAAQGTQQVRGAARQPAVVLHSSGTTGLPKPVPLSHACLCAMLDVMRRRDSNFVPDDVFVINTPFYWITATVSILMSMDFGVQVVAPVGMDPVVFRDTIHKFKATAALSATHCWTSMAKLRDTTPEAFGTLRYAVSSGSALDAEKTSFLESRLGTRMSQWYGTTEVLVATGITAKDTHQPAGSVGALSAYTQAKVVDVQSGQPLGAGQDGEICFRGPLSSLAVQPGAWFHTGDIGHFDQAGWLYIVDRVKDLIKFRGIHVSPSELESILLSHPVVADAVVLGRPHLTDTEHPAAFVVPRPDATATQEELVHFVADKLAAYPHKHLRGGVFFVESLNRTAVGKLRRWQLLQQLEAMASGRDQQS